MTHNRIGTRLLLIAVLYVIGLTVTGPVWSLDSRQQSTGPGVTQGEDGSMSTKQGGNTGPTTGRNEDSGSATGTVRDPSKAEPPPGKHSGSGQVNSGSSQETKQTKGQKQSGTSTDK